MKQGRVAIIFMNPITNVTYIKLIKPYIDGTIKVIVSIKVGSLMKIAQRCTFRNVSKTLNIPVEALLRTGQGRVSKYALIVSRTTLLVVYKSFQIYSTLVKTLLA